jgi:hypothetical protein
MPQPEMVPLSSLMTRQQFETMQFMMSRPRWDASGPTQTAGPTAKIGTVDSQAQLRENASKYASHQRAQGECVHTGSAAQPVGGRMQRNFKLNSSRPEWTDADEAAYQKAFGKSSQR